MPINLTTKWHAGSVHGNVQYSQAKLIDYHFSLKKKRMVMEVEFGDTVDGEWVVGKTGKFSATIADAPESISDPAVTDFTDFIVANKALYDQVAATLYAKLQELHPEKMAGTVV